jgi:RNA ligase
MKEYHKIQTMFKRDMANQAKIIEGVWTLPEFEYLKDNKWVFTEKVDGTNIRIKWESKVMSLGGKTDNAQIPASLIDAIRVMDLIPKLEAAFPEFDCCLYGEGYGTKIQKGGGNYRQDQSFVLFDVKVGDWWLERHNVEDVATKLGLDVVPIIGEGTLADGVELVRNGLNSTWGGFAAEGIVARPSVELKTRNGERIITKIKHIDFVKAAKAA